MRASVTPVFYRLRERKRKLLVCAIGPPKIGKGAHFKHRFRVKWGAWYKSTGDGLRARGQAGTGGANTPDTIMIPMIRELVYEFKASEFQVGILDGAPRNEDQARDLRDYCAAHDIDLLIVMLQSNNDDELLSRGRDDGPRDDDAFLRERIARWNRDYPKIIPVLAMCRKLVQVNGIGDFDTIHAEIETELAHRGVLEPIPDADPFADHVHAMTFQTA